MKSRYRLTGFVTLSLAKIQGHLRRFHLIFCVVGVVNIINIKIVTCLAYALICFLIIYMEVAYQAPTFTLFIDVLQ